MPKPLHAEHYHLFLNLLRKVREQGEVTQAQLGAALGEDQTFVSKCETGIRRLDVVELRLWLKALGTSLPAFVQELDAYLDAQLAQASSRARAARRRAR